MIPPEEKHRFLIGLIEGVRAADQIAVARGIMTRDDARHRQALLTCIADDYRDQSRHDETTSIEAMRPWFVSQLAQGRSIDQMARDCEAPRHRIVFALNLLELKS